MQEDRISQSDGVRPMTYTEFVHRVLEPPTKRSLPGQACRRFQMWLEQMTCHRWDQDAVYGFPDLSEYVVFANSRFESLTDQFEEYNIRMVDLVLHSEVRTGNQSPSRNGQKTEISGSKLFEELNSWPTIHAAKAFFEAVDRVFFRVEIEKVRTASGRPMDSKFYRHRGPIITSLRSLLTSPARSNRRNTEEALFNTRLNHLLHARKNNAHVDDKIMNASFAHVSRFRELLVEPDIAIPRWLVASLTMVLLMHTLFDWEDATEVLVFHDLIPFLLNAYEHVDGLRFDPKDCPQRPMSARFVIEQISDIKTELQKQQQQLIGWLGKDTGRLLTANGLRKHFLEQRTGKTESAVFSRKLELFAIERMLELASANWVLPTNTQAATTFVLDRFCPYFWLAMQIPEYLSEWKLFIQHDVAATHE